MKKLALIVLLAASAAVASAADVGLRFGRNTATDTNATGVTISQKFGTYGAEVSFDRTNGVLGNDRYSLLGTYNVAKVRDVTVTAKAGVAYVVPYGLDSGAAAIVGVGVSYPLTTKVSLTADYAYQYGQSRVNALNGSTVTAGVKYAF